jgi:hypothetical protein
MTHVVNDLGAVAAFFNKSRRTAQRWARCGMPRTADGWDTHQVEAWLKASKYKGGLARMEEEAQIRDLVELAVRELRRGLEDLCRAYARTRGGRRREIIDQAVKQLLHRTQGELLDQTEE